MKLATCSCGKVFVDQWETLQVTFPLPGFEARDPRVMAAVEVRVCSHECAAQMLALGSTRPRGIQ